MLINFIMAYLIFEVRFVFFIMIVLLEVKYLFNNLGLLKIYILRLF
jgi:hypothetical protein